MARGYQKDWIAKGYFSTKEEYDAVKEYNYRRIIYPLSAILLPFVWNCTLSVSYFFPVSSILLTGIFYSYSVALSTSSTCCRRRCRSCYSCPRRTRRQYDLSKKQQHNGLYLSIFIFIFISIYLSNHLSIYLSIYLYIYICLYLSIYLSIHPSIYLSKQIS